MKAIVLDGVRCVDETEARKFMDDALRPLSLGTVLRRDTEWVKTLVLHHVKGRAIYGDVIYFSVYMPGKKSVRLHFETNVINLSLGRWLRGCAPRYVACTYKLGERPYNTKSSIKEVCKELVDSYSTSTGSCLSATDSELVRDVVSAYPRADEMMEDFVKFIIVEDFGPTFRPFGIVKGDGSVVVFSYHNAIDGKFDYKPDLVSAKRNHVLDQVQAFRSRNIVDGRGVCAVTGVEASSKELHVDHNFDVITFAELWQDFLATQGISDANVDTVRGGNCSQRFFADHQLAKDWSAYHASHAQLRLVLAKVNLRGKNYQAHQDTGVE